jgi:adenylylsulfate reductase subunit B
VPWGTGKPELKDVPAPTQEKRDSQHLWSEPEMIRMDDGDVHTLKSNGLKMKLGVSY